jgi:hypothetical protein
MARRWRQDADAERPARQVAGAGAPDHPCPVRQCRLTKLKLERQEELLDVEARPGGAVQPAVLPLTRPLVPEPATQAAAQRPSPRAQQREARLPARAALPLRRGGGGALMLLQPVRLPPWPPGPVSQSQRRDADAQRPAEPRHVRASRAPNERECGQPGRRSVD